MAQIIINRQQGIAYDKIEQEKNSSLKNLESILQAFGISVNSYEWNNLRSRLIEFIKRENTFSIDLTRNRATNRPLLESKILQFTTAHIDNPGNIPTEYIAAAFYELFRNLTNNAAELRRIKSESIPDTDRQAKQKHDKRGASGVGHEDIHRQSRPPATESSVPPTPSAYSPPLATKIYAYRINGRGVYILGLRLSFSILPNLILRRLLVAPEVSPQTLFLLFHN
ncbi:MAG: hypothetical protein Q9204_001756 [Flavoplaca sp. TL-2023a]